MTDSSSVSPALAALGADGWSIAPPGVQQNSVGAEATQRGGAGEVYVKSRGAGERNPGATTGADHLAVAGEWMTKLVNYNDVLGTRTIYAGPCLIAGFEVTTAMSAHASNLEDNAVSRYPIPASRPVGIYTFPGPITFRTSAIWNPGSLAAGQILFWYRPLDSVVTW